VVIPTFWARRRGGYTDRLINVYDHPTPVDEDGTLPDCLRSLQRVAGLDRVIVIVAAADASIEHEAEDRVRSILARFPDIDTKVFGPAELGSLHRRLEQLEFSDMVPGVSLTGYGAVRNVGLIVAATLGCDSVVFVDDDEIITDTDFLERAMVGLGTVSPDGKTVLAKTGYYVDEAGSPRLPDENHWADAFWRVNAEFNRSTAAIEKAPRLKVSNVAYGGCLALHKDMFVNVSFDPWVLRGEDVDYVINARMHGGDVFLDNEWRVVHKPPSKPSEAIALRQDVYRFIYEHRKLEFAKSQVDLRQVSASSLRPYPGDLVASPITWRAFMTAVLHALTGKETGAFLEVAKAALNDASRYARRNCDNYFAFQRRWPLMMDRIWEDIALGSLFSGERSVDRTAITGRFPIVPPSE
jgi:glycosyltransferase involved in cell wall biosynthesis